MRDTLATANAPRHLFIRILSLFFLFLNVQTLHAIGFEAKTLVILDDPKIPHTHSIFFKDLKNRGHKLSFFSAKDRTLKAGKYGEFEYDNVILFSPSTEDFGGDFDVTHMTEFLDSGRNAMVIVDSDPTETNRELANECGIDFDSQNTMVIDHVHHDIEGDEQGMHTKVIGKLTEDSKNIVGDISVDTPIVYNGIGHAINDDSSLIFKVLTASPTGYSYVPGKVVKEYPESAGSDTVLVSAVQSRSNSRITFVGSREMFSNKYFNAPVKESAFASLATPSQDAKSPAKKAGNQAFASALSKWNFREKGVLRAVNFTHQKLDGGAINPATYRVSEDLVVKLVIQEFMAESNSWEPFTHDDVQIELVMMDPYVRATMETDGKGNYKSTLKAPDVYGCYKIKISYRRPGFSAIEVMDSVSVKPYRHDEYDRFLLVAYPYYASAFSLMVGFLTFGVYFLYGKFE
eukprot:jgi/Bigna1/69572/fgenesh1_pg.9_\